MSTSSARSSPGLTSSPTHQHGPATSHPLDETPRTRTERELEEDMASSPIRPPSNQGDDDDMLPEPMGLANGEPAIPPRTNQRNEVGLAKRLAREAKLLPYQRQALEEFTLDSNLIRDLKLFVNQCTIENKLDAIILATPKFVISDALQDNIESYSAAVLLSSELSAYKGVIPRDHVLDILAKNRLHLPENYEKDRYITNMLKEAVQEALTQRRSAIKKAIRLSRGDAALSLSIYDLAGKVIVGTRCTITVPLCARLALLRKKHVEDSSGKFWDKVDEHLSLIRTKADKDRKKISRALSKVLDNDRKLYGSDALVTATDTVDAWQQGINEQISGEFAAGEA